eukprot:6699021-Ditylum_brightwellii.AAC.1
MASRTITLLDVKCAFLNERFQNDDCLTVGPKEIVEKSMMRVFECKELGEMGKHVGCKVERSEEEGHIKLTQP